ncbi:MAG: hypothetical protein RBU21_19405 [FCB group bacterium]|jgi:hypothetical protein|nr:hypothetical protein [FCB group bacterium]
MSMKAAQEALRAKRASGELKVNRRSLAKPLKEYFLDLAGVYLNKGCRDAPIKEMRAEAMANFKSAKAEGYAAAVQRICFDCVGGDDDVGPKLQVRDCAFKDCPLYPVRPWQTVKNPDRTKEGAD